MKPIINIIVFLFLSNTLVAQSFKDEISVVQFSAPFTKASEISLKKFNDYNIYTFLINEKKDVFEKENIKYLPTIILYHNGEEIIRIESGISLKLPENTIQLIEEEIEEIIESKF
ncbi:MAG: hypothetical protein Tp133SUR523431_46 [Prokaryotic dsDNA virus sp.]|nr:MAG: hypothetical protein Tp133SUR523431_46 [Prokaryotic dsDNA virus sp.]|tara:strand:- start:1802 stop:2146 length:345 start_codon:yes stop_codon:yes gene_type:complete